MRRSLFIAILLCALISIRASATTVTGTVTDPDAVNWANGFITFTLTGNAGQGYACAGTPMTADQTKVTATMNGSGVFSTTLCANNTITPVNTQWAIQVFSAASAAPQTITPTTVNGSSQDLSTYINGLIKAIRIPAVTKTRAYADGEIVTPIGGTTYYNIGSGTIRLYNGVAWLTLSTGASGVANLTSTGGTLSITNGTGPTTNAELALNHANNWGIIQTSTVDGQNWTAISPVGDSVGYWFTPNFADAFAYITANDGNASFIVQARLASVAGFKAGGSPFSPASASYRLAAPGTSGQIMSDSVAGDTLVNAPSGQVNRIGAGTGNSTMQVGIHVGYTCVVLSGATPVIGNGPCYTLTLTTATTPTLTPPIINQHTFLQICQDATAGRTYTPPAGMHGAISGASILAMTSGLCANQTFQNVNGSTNLQAESAGVTGVTP